MKFVGIAVQRYIHKIIVNIDILMVAINSVNNIPSKMGLRENSFNMLDQ